MPDRCRPPGLISPTCPATSARRADILGVEMQTASEMSTEQGSPPAGPPDARIDGIGGIGLEFASNTQPNGISPKKVRELAMRKVESASAPT